MAANKAYRLVTASLFTGLLLSYMTPLCQVTGSPAEKDSMVWVDKDDPIAAMLDSLLYRQYFECSEFSTDTGLLNVCAFPSDSIPRYDDDEYRSRIAALDARTPIALAYNDAVRKFIELYVVRKRNLSSRILGLAELYFPMFEEVLDAHQLPLELKYLAIVESALNPNAVSRAGATGIWQFMYRTGKLYNLEVTSYVDMRRDPYLATIAACRYFEYLYGMFHDWNLVLAAYNSGPGTVSRAIRRSGGETDYWKLRTFLPSETRGYVPAFIAAVYFMNYASEHNLYPIPPRKLYYEVDTLKVRKSLSLNRLAAVLEIPEEDLTFLNPVYKLGQVPAVEEPMTLTLPVQKIPAFINNAALIYTIHESRDSLPDGTPVEYQTREVKEYHTVRSGDYLGAIASRYKCTVGQLQAWNNLHSNIIYPGQRLVIRKEVTEAVPVARPDFKEELAKDKDAPEKDHGDVQYIYYVVQPGDTLIDIANKHTGITVTHLRELNGLEESQEPSPGTKIKVSVKG